MKIVIAFFLVLCCANVNGQSYKWTAPFGKFKTEFSPYDRAVIALPKITNTSGVSVSIPGYWYSSDKQQNAVIGLGYTFQHYVDDSLLYAVGPYIWYRTPVPIGGAVQLPLGYGAAATYKGLLLFGILTTDWVHWGPVVTLNFSFGNGGISL